jgi:hypothetical protein
LIFVILKLNCKGLRGTKRIKVEAKQKSQREEFTVESRRAKVRGVNQNNSSRNLWSKIKGNYGEPKSNQNKGSKTKRKREVEKLEIKEEISNQKE